MKIKMSPFSSLASEAKRLGVPESVVRDYQQARSIWKKRVSFYAKKYGGVESIDIPQDIRQIKKTGDDVEDFLRSRTVTIKSRSRVASRYIRDRQAQYVLNIASVAEREGVDVITPEFLDWVGKASPKELSDVINIIGLGVLEQYYSTGFADDDEGAEEAKNGIERAKSIVDIGSILAR